MSDFVEPHSTLQATTSEPVIIYYSDTQSHCDVYGE